MRASRAPASRRLAARIQNRRRPPCDRHASLLPRHLYLHVPFCARRCSYCDFSIAVRRVVPVDEFVRGVTRELELRAGCAGDWHLETVYLGGGTPSRLGPLGVQRLMDVLRSRATIAPRAEVTLEANPDDVHDAALVRAWKAAGVTRVSLGAQSFQDPVLAWMRRSHDAATIRRAVQALDDAGLESWSVDLIFALPANLRRDWAADLDAALALRPPHLSLYGLTVDAATPLGKWRDRGDVVETPDEEYEREFLLAHASLTAAGYQHYEVSNFARPGHRARHNSAYWTGAAYLGLGPSAHGFDGAERRWNRAAYADWLATVSGGDDPCAGRESLTAAQRDTEEVYLGLRTDHGLRLVPSDQAEVDRWVNAGWAVHAGERVVLTALGWLRLDALASSLTLCRSRYYN